MLQCAWSSFSLKFSHYKIAVALRLSFLQADNMEAPPVPVEAETVRLNNVLSRKPVAASWSFFLL